MTRQYSLD